MKTLYLLLCCFILTFSSIYAQENNTKEKNIIGISPFKTWEGLQIKYERVQNQNFTYGTFLTGYYAEYLLGGEDFWNGVQLQPFARYYFKHNAPKGWYVQGKLSMGIFEAVLGEVDNESVYTYKMKTFSAFAVGATIGYQALFGKEKRFVLDTSIGLRASTQPEDQQYDNFFSTGTYWMLIGPGSIIDGLFSIGYRF